MSDLIEANAGEANAQGTNTEVEPETQTAPGVRLAEILDLKAAAPLASELLSHRGQPVEIDASQVSRLGGQCTQILLSAVATWRADEVPLSIRDPSASFLESLELLGIQPADLMDQELFK